MLWRGISWKDGHITLSGYPDGATVHGVDGVHAAELQLHLPDAHLRQRHLRPEEDAAANFASLKQHEDLKSSRATRSSLKMEGT